MKASLGPQIVFSPTFAVFYAELKTRLPNPSAVSISGTSTLLIKGGGDVTIEGLELDGTLEIEVGDLPRCIAVRGPASHFSLLCVWEKEDSARSLVSFTFLSDILNLALRLSVPPSRPLSPPIRTYMAAFWCELVYASTMFAAICFFKSPDTVLILCVRELGLGPPPPPPPAARQQQRRSPLSGPSLWERRRSRRGRRWWCEAWS